MSAAKASMLAALDSVIGGLLAMRKILAAAPFSDAMCSVMEGHIAALTKDAAKATFAMRDTAMGTISGQPGGAA